MLIEFRVANFRSLKDEQALTLEAAPVSDLTDARLRTVSTHCGPLLPAAVIYGSNASGKSNVLVALAFMREAVVHSLEGWAADKGVPRTAFAWSGKSRDQSMFEVTFVTQGVKYQYGFAADDQRIAEEWLFAWPDGNRQVWLERDGQRFSIGSALIGPSDSALNATRSNCLLLSVACSMGHPQLRPVSDWFQRIFTVNIAHRLRKTRLSPGNSGRPSVLGSVAESWQADSSIWRLSLELLRAADLGIVDIRSVQVPPLPAGESQRLQLRHTHDENSWLDLEEESEGTKSLIRMAPSIVQAIESGGVLLVDELESSLHPLIGAAIVKLFNSPQSNPRGAQVLFTTHDTRMLAASSDAPLLRRDQIWFAEKNPEGASTIYPLTDYQPSQSENLESGYLQGRYGAIPFCGDISWIKE
jgi:predicted ATPase